MIFQLSRELFAKDSSDLPDLLTILRLAFDGRHVVFVEDNTAFESWRSRRTQPEQHWTREAIESSLRGVPHVEKFRARVCASTTSNWRASPPELSLRDAALLSRAPLRLVLEDFEDDACFLRWIGRAINDATWDKIDDAMKRGWIEVVHGGGNGSMRRLVDALDGTRTDLPWGMSDGDCHLKAGLRPERTWVMFDHDGLAPGPGQRGANAGKLAARCSERRVAHHGLERRSIENYLPLALLQRWARADFDAREQLTTPEIAARRRLLVDAFSVLKLAQRRHYYFREGLRKDAIRDQNDPRRDGSLPEVWASLSFEAQAALACGFDGCDRDGITRLFQHERAQVQRRLLQQDGSDGEARAILRSIAEAM